VGKRGGCHPEINNEEALGKEMSRRGFEKRRKVRKEDIERNGLKKREEGLRSRETAEDFGRRDKEKSLGTQ
jgi:hypothetical protein